MGHSLLPDGISQCPRHVLLATHVGEALGPVPPVKGLVGVLSLDGGRHYRGPGTGVLVGLGGVGHSFFRLPEHAKESGQAWQRVLTALGETLKGVPVG